MNQPAERVPQRAMRAALGVVALALGTLGWYAIVNGASGALPGSRALGAMLVSLCGFFALTFARTPTRPFGPLRLVLGIAVALSLVTILSMPLPPRAETVGSDVALGIVILLALSAGLLIVPRPRVARGLLVALAALGVTLDYAVVRYLTWPAVTSDIKSAAAIITIIGSACVAALLLARPPRGGSQVSRTVH
jgi:hypothetical protein